jgi:hypothetical protein
MKAFLLAMTVPAMLLISFRNSNMRFELSDIEEFARVCTQFCAHICAQRI